MIIPFVESLYATQQCTDDVNTWNNAPFEMQFIPERIETGSEFNLANTGIMSLLVGGLTVIGGALIGIPTVVGLAVVGGSVAVATLVVGYFFPAWIPTVTVNLNQQEFTNEEIEAINWTKATLQVPDDISCGWHWACRVAIPDIAYTRTNLPVIVGTPVLHYGYVSVVDQFGARREGWVIPADENGFRSINGIAIENTFKVYEEHTDLYGNLLDKRIIPFDLEVTEVSDSDWVNRANLYFELGEVNPFAITSYLVEYGLNKNDKNAVLIPYPFQMTPYNKTAYYNNTDIEHGRNFLRFNGTVETSSSPEVVKVIYRITDHNNQSAFTTGTGFIESISPTYTFDFYASLPENLQGRSVDIELETNTTTTWFQDNTFVRKYVDYQDYVRYYSTHHINDYVEFYDNRDQYDEAPLDLGFYTSNIRSPNPPFPYMVKIHIGLNCTEDSPRADWLTCPNNFQCPDSDCVNKTQIPSGWFRASNEEVSDFAYPVFYHTGRTVFDGERVVFDKVVKDNITKTMYLWKGKDYFDVVIEQHSPAVWNFTSPLLDGKPTWIHEDANVLVYDVVEASGEIHKAVISQNHTDNLEDTRFSMRYYVFPSGTPSHTINNTIYLDFVQPLYYVQCGTTQTNWLRLTDLPIINYTAEGYTVDIEEEKIYKPIIEVITTTTAPPYVPPEVYTENWFEPLFNVSVFGDQFQFLGAFVTPFFLATLLLIVLSALAGVGFGMVEGAGFNGQAFGISALLLAIVYTVIGIYPMWIGITFVILAGFLVARTLVSAMGG